MRFASILAGALLLLDLGTVPLHAEKRVALVIGNGAYQNTPALINPKNDAQDVGRSLAEIGFETIVATDLDRAGMNDALDRFSRMVAGADIAFVYYSGHGMQFNGRNYLLPIDARLTGIGDVNRFRLMPLDDVLEVLQNAHGAHIVVLDACRDNPLEVEFKRRLAAVPGANRDAFVTRGLGRLSAGNGLVVAYATQPGDVAADGTGRNSPFTAAFLHNVAAPNIDLRQMLFRVQDEVDRTTDHRQRPELSMSLVGEFKLNAMELSSLPPAAPVGAPPAFDAAAQAWAVTKDTTSVAVLEDFNRQFGDTPYGSMARARLDELRRKTVDLTPPPLQPKSIPSPAQAALPARPPRPSISSESCASFNGSAGADLYCASSVLASEYGNSYDVRNLFNSNSVTAWVHGTHQKAVGQWIVVEFDGLRLVHGVTIRNGYQKNADVFGKNTRVRQLRLIFSQGESKLVELEDRSGEQTIMLDRPLRAYWVKFLIEEVFPGWKYPDTAISKLFVASDPVPLR